MLSICIPVFNEDVTSLVRELHEQAIRLGTNSEILVFDDASDEGFRKKNRELRQLPGVSYRELERNIGRSRIRNLMAREAAFPYLIFMDCDSELSDPGYLDRYLRLLPCRQLVYGGRRYPDAPPRSTDRLHWVFGMNREQRSAGSRERTPYQSFMSNNFMVPREVLLQIPFNELLSGYGHEDTLLGFEMKKHGIPIRHIDNPLLHTGLETPGEFLKKTRQGIANLVLISRMLNGDKDFTASVSLLKTCELLRRMGLRKLFHRVFGHLRRPIERQLTGPSPRLWLLDLYKLGSICAYSRKKTNATQ